MNNVKSTFSGFSVSNIQDAKDFYISTLGLDLVSEAMGLDIRLPGDARLFLYEKEDHQPASFTVLNFVVQDIDAAVDELVAKGINFAKYELGDGVTQDKKGILRGKTANMGPDIAWFTDPAGNVLALLED